MNKRKAILWFRQDLRIHDNEALQDALSVASEIIPVYVFDSRLFNGYGRYGFRRIGKQRAQFILESVQDLRQKLQSLGSDLILRIGIPEEEIFAIAREVKTSWVFCNRERTPEEVSVQDLLEEKLWSIGQELRYSRGKMLYYTQDLPFPITQVPDHFATFRKEVEKVIPVRRPLESPPFLSRVSEKIERGELPSLEDFGWNSTEEKQSYLPRLKGGETAALGLVDRIVHQHTQMVISRAPIDLNNLYISPYLTLGCLSPKYLYWSIREIGEKIGAREERLLYELLVRDFLRLQVKKHGASVFHEGGIRGTGDEHLEIDRKKFSIWANAQTQEPYVNAYMNHLLCTGYCPQIGRLSLSVYLLHTLGVHWHLGAEFFESRLIDYDPCSNWANWNIVAGVGAEYKDFSQYNIAYQSSRMDPEGSYLEYWSNIEYDQSVYSPVSAQ